MPESGGPSLGRMEERLKGVVDDVAEVKRELYGNGNRGLKTAMTELRQAFRLGTWIASIIAGALILDLSSRLFDLVAEEKEDTAPASMPAWMRDALSPRNDPRAEDLRNLRRRVEALGDENGGG